LVQGTIIDMFDWRQFKRFNIREDSLPPGSIVPCDLRPIPFGNFTGDISLPPYFSFCSKAG
jgi:hypothetical protein